MQILKTILIWIWCFPQQLAGLIVRAATRAKKVEDHYEYNIGGGSVTLGTYIFLCPSRWGDAITLSHEKGHTKQSLYLGGLYLLVIGLPSIIWAGCFKQYRARKRKSYYSFYTEKWADKLGGVTRD